MSMLTNKPNHGTGPDFPEDFRAACLIYGLSPKNVLQHFIDHTFVCASFSPPEKEYDAFPVAVIYQYVDICGKSLLTPESQKNRRQSIRFLRQIAGISGAAGLTPPEKRAACTAAVGNWHRELEPNSCRSASLTLDGGLRLRISRDFMLLCEVFGLRPEEILYHFTCQISLPWAKSQIRSNVDPAANPAMAFFLPVMRGQTGIRRKNKYMAHPDIQLHYLQQLQELDLRLRFNRNVARREEFYRELYRAWYQALVSAKKTDNNHEKDHSH